jgi:hypothetical protein
MKTGTLAEVVVVAATMERQPRLQGALVEAAREMTAILGHVWRAWDCQTREAEVAVAAAA